MTRIRPATTSDAAAVADLSAQLGYPTDEQTVAMRIGLLTSRPDHVVLVAVGAEDRPVGWIHLERSWSLAEDSQVVIGGLVVSEADRSAGIGAELIQAGERWARGHGGTRMVVRTRTTRQRAHRFYEREGFRLVKESRVYAKTL
jgi:GNAT superfamily N-acetyltransferase